MHDVGHTKRLARLLDRLSERPVGRIPTAWHGWAEPVAASRFLHNPNIDAQEILSGHPHATRERRRAQERVMLVQDTPFLHYGTPQPPAGMGTGKSKTREESLLHPPVVFTPERIHCGVVGRKVWQRPEQPVAQQRKHTPIEEKERSRWRAGDQGACKITPAWSATWGVNMADRAGDSQEWLVDALRREPRPRAEGIMRAKWNRRLVPGTAQRDVWAERPQTTALGTLPIDRARPPERPPRP
jgi:hypothetical protein